MSPTLDTWYSLPDLDRLARLERPLTGTFPIDRLPRLAAVLANPEGSVETTIELRNRSDGRLEIGLRCTAAVELICQRCLEPFVHTLVGQVDYLLVDEEQTGSGVPVDVEDIEVLALAGERLNPKVLIEDELLVSLPFVPRHASERECGTLARKLEQLSSDYGGGDGNDTAEH
jgi:uncharacterized protein